MRTLLILFICALALPVMPARAVSVLDQPEYQQRAKNMPKDVQKWLARAIECFQWKMEPSYDPARAKFIKAQLKGGHCARVQRDGSVLARKYKKKADISQTIKEAKRDFGRSVKPIKN